MKKTVRYIMALTFLCWQVNLAKGSGSYEIPKIYNISDAVCPGKAFRINGYGFNNNKNLQVALEKNSDGIIRTVPALNAIAAEIIQKDRDGNFLVAVLPADIAPGLYNLWVKNETGWSDCKRLNAARPLFMSEREAFEGITIKIVGRNFDCMEFGVNTTPEATKVRLFNGSGKKYEVPVHEYNPFCIHFTLQDVPPGKYYVEVSNDGGINWSLLENGQNLTVTEKPKKSVNEYDPLNMGVAWASHFNWTNVYKVPPSDGSADITEQVQTIVNKVSSDKNGGVVYFPGGTYKISHIDLPKNVILKGKNNSETIISYNGTGKNFISCVGSSVTEGHVGICNVSIIVPDEVKSRPDIFINLGQSVNWEGVENLDIRSASEMFICNVKLDYNFTETEKDRRGLPVCVIGKERLYISNCDFKGFRLESHNYVSEYVTVKNNHFEFAQGVFIYTGDFLFLENNHIVGHREYTREKHGFMFRANAYIYKNKVDHTGSEEDPFNENWNDGEGLCHETPGGSHNFGEVNSAGKYSILPGKMAGKIMLPLTHIYNHLTVLIVDGKGLGQYRRVKKTDRSSGEIVVEKEWDIVPDSSSKFTLMNANENTTYYQNEIYDNPKGYWLFGNSLDCVVADNLSIDCDGVFIFSCRYVNKGNNPPMYFFVPNYFNRIVRNRIMGVSRKSHRAGIGVNCTREDMNGAYYGVQTYALDIRNNYIIGRPDETPLNSVTEAPAVSGIFLWTTLNSSMYDGKNVAGDITNTIIEDNILNNLSSGINLSRCIYGQVIRNNTFDQSVRKQIDDGGSQNTRVIQANPKY